MVGKNYESAVLWGRKAAQVNPNYTGVLRMLAASLAHAGHIVEAKQVALRILKIEPAFRISAFRYPFRRNEDLVRYFDGLYKAGLPV
jgi:hypothetical protein